MYEFSQKCACGKQGVTYNGRAEIVCYDCSSESHKKLVRTAERIMSLSKNQEGNKKNGE